MLTSPKQNKKIPQGIIHGVNWSADNGCFTGFDEKKFLSALGKWSQYSEYCLFVNAPDVLLDAKGTLESFKKWQPIIKSFGLPIAFTIQNDAHLYPIPWDECDALFIGSNNKYKYSDHVLDLIAIAKSRGLWVHNGRTNSPNSIQWFLRSGADSFDGSGYSRYPPKIKKHLIYQSMIIPKLFD
jgi:hypothetical protein